MGKNRMNLCLSRQNFRIITDESPEYMMLLESLINKQITEVQRQYPGISTTRCILLAMLNMEDEMYKTKKELESLEEKLTKLRGLPVQQGAVEASEVAAEKPAAQKQTTRNKKTLKQPVGV